MRVTKAAVRVDPKTTAEQAVGLSEILKERLPEIEWSVIAADDVIVLETVEGPVQHDPRKGLETR